MTDEHASFHGAVFGSRSIYMLARNTAGDLTAWNLALAQLFGRKPEELLGTAWSVIAMPDEHRNADMHEFQRITATGLPDTQRTALVLPDGSLRMVLWSHTLTHENDTLTGVLSFGIDTTYLQFSEPPEPGTLNREQLISILDHSGDFIATATSDGRVVHLNDAFKHIASNRSGHDDRMRAFLTLADFHPPEVGTMILSTAVPSAVKRGFWQGESVLLDASRRPFTVLETILAHADTGGFPRLLSFICRPAAELNPPPVIEDPHRLNSLFVSREVHIAKLKKEVAFLRAKLKAVR